MNAGCIGNGKIPCCGDRTALKDDRDDIDAAVCEDDGASYVKVQAKRP